MAITGTYSQTTSAVTEIYLASSGGTVFSANVGTTTNFDYFPDTAVVNDAIYFARGANGVVTADLVFNVGTAMAGTDIVLAWEYYKRGVGWTAMECVKDDTNGFTVTGTNRVWFPLQWDRNPTTINGLNRMWTRCRIVSIGTITEGGANTTSRVLSGDAKVIISGGTDAVPATFTNLYNWCIANIPWVTVSKSESGSFDFTKIAFQFTGRCLTYNEVIEIGPNNPSSQGGGSSSLDYVTSGVLYGTSGIKGSTFIVHGGPNSGVLNNGLNTRLYGTVIKTGKTNADANKFEGYHSLIGENVDCFFELSMYLVSANVVNSRIVNGIIIANPPTIFEGNSYFTNSDQVFYCYTSGFTLRDFSLKFTSQPPTTVYACFIYQGSGYYNQDWNFINPGFDLGTIDGYSRPVIVSGPGAPITLQAVKFYNSLTGTYTDYTSQASSSTTNDIPLTGEVGDYYLFGRPDLSVSSSFSLLFTIPTQSNDYEYVWEVWRSRGWTAIPQYWDTTLNLTQDGYVYTSENYYATASTIDGVSSKWLRARIVKKGTTNPVASKIQSTNHGGVSNWRVREQWAVNIKVVDNNGSPLENATVTATNSTGEVFSVTTDSDGEITEQIMTSKEWYFDPVNNVNQIGQTLYPTFGLSISKDGYETYNSSGNSLDNKVDIVLSLKPIKQVRPTTDGDFLIALQPELGSSSLLEN